jgi:hypothetical protein
MIDLSLQLSCTSSYLESFGGSQEGFARMNTLLGNRRAGIYALSATKDYLRRCPAISYALVSLPYRRVLWNDTWR